MCEAMVYPWLHLRHCILYEFQQGRNATEACRNLLKVFGEGTVSNRTCRRWFRKFESGDMNLSDNPRSGRPSLIDDYVVKTMLEQDPFLTTSEIAERLNSAQQTISDHIRKIGLVWKYSRWVPHEFCLIPKTDSTIGSFFVPKGSTNITKKSPRKSSDTEEGKDCSADDDSPVKCIKSKKRCRISSSESENESENDAPKNKIVKSAKVNAGDKSPEALLAEKTPEKELKRKETIAKGKRSPKERKGLLKKDEKEKKPPKASSPEEKNGTGKDKTVENSDASTYNPNSTKYDPIRSACWKQGEKVPYYALARTFEEIENESGRLKSIEIFSNYLRSVIVLTPDDLLHSIYLSLNKLSPAHEGLELGLSEQTLNQVISQSTGRTVTQIRAEIQKVGDIGLVAERSRSSQKLLFKPAPLTVAGIFKKLHEIAKMTGSNTVKKKICIVKDLFTACKGPEARFLIRSLNGCLRIGLAETSVLQALALACAATPPGQSYPPEKVNVAATMSSESFKSAVSDLALTLKTTYCECPNYELIIPVILKEGISALPERCRITPGLPMKPMLAQPTKGVQEVLTRFDGLEFTCEFKYDGERAQIHCSETGVVNIFSRNQENNTSKYPDIISRISRAKKDGVTSFILDCEAVAWDKEHDRILPFQVLSTRKKKEAVETEIKVPVCVFMFDLLYLNGKPLVKEKFFERRRLLHENFNEVKGEWMFPSALDTSTMEEVQEFLEESVKGNCEGLMVKTLKEEATYEIAKRSRNWLKLKKDYLDGVGDTLDLVVLGGYLGKGKRTGTYGGFLVGCYDEDSEEYQSVCKLGTGFSDESLAVHAEFFKNHVIKSAPSYYQHDATLEPDHWFEPVQVWEIKCADISLSPIHRAAIGVVDPEKGISLRFPRFLRIREDKKPEEATTSQQLISLYHNQEQVKSQQGKFTKFKEEDFY